MAALPAILMPLPQQKGAVMHRIEGVAGRFSGEGQDNTGMLIAILVVLGLGLVALVAYRAFLWQRFQKTFGPQGFGLDWKGCRRLWDQLDANSRQNPNLVLDSRERFAALLESLAKRGHHEELRELHTLWLARDEKSREPQRGREGFVQLEHIRLRRDDGFVIDGFLRRVGSDAIDFVVSEPATQLPLAEEEFVIERARGEHIGGCALDVQNLHGPWTFGVGPQARAGQQRSEFRVSLALEALVFEASPRLDTIRAELADPEISDHHLLAKHQLANPKTAEDLFSKWGFLDLAEIVRLDDFSALGVRFRLREPRIEIDTNKPLYLFLPFDVDGRSEEYLISAVTVEVWTETLDGQNVDHVLRCRFFEIEEEEVRRLRHLVNRLAAAGQEVQSRAAKILDRRREGSPS